MFSCASLEFVRFFKTVTMPTALIWLVTAGAAARDIDDSKAAPQLRPAVEVDRGHVTLGDLFTNSGDKADIPVMQAPPPGEITQISTHEAFELANAHGLAWRPITTFDQVAISRAWRHLDRGQLEAMLHSALQAAGAGSTLELDLPSELLQVKVARGALVEPRFTDVIYEPRTSRFRATLVADASSGAPLRITIAGKAVAVAKIPVLHSRLGRDSVIRAEDLTWKTVPADRLPAGTITDQSGLIGQSPRKPVVPGRPITHADVGAPTAVTKGALVTMYYRRDNLSLVAMGRALESGAVGDFISIQNTQSQRSVEGVVVGRNEVAFEAGIALTLAEPQAGGVR